MNQFLDLQGNFSLLLLSLIVLPLIYMIVTHYVSSSASNSPPLPPGPTRWPIIGNIPQMWSSTTPHVTLANFAKLYGPLISLKLGTQCLIVASSPEAAKQILKSKDRIFSGRYVPHALPIPKSELNQTSLGWTEECNEYWKYLRTLCRTEVFSNKALDSQAKLREENMTDLMDFLRAKEGVVKIAELVFATVFNMLGNALMSREFISLEDTSGDSGLKGVIRGFLEVVAAPNLSDFYPILTKLDVQGLKKKALGFVLRLRAVWGPIIEERRNERTNNSVSHQDFLDTLLDNDFTDNRINQLFTELFAAATDTTTSTIEWTIAELIKTPESMKRVREEIEYEIKQDYPGKSHLMNLPYLEACIKETLRLHPPAPFLLPHRALETCQVMDYTVPKNAQVLVNVWAIGRDPSIWEEPLKFKPERFLESSIDFKGNDFEFLPFSGGRRICPGIPMAAKIVPLILVLLIHFFDWSVLHGVRLEEMNMSEKFGVTIFPRVGNDYKHHCPAK